MSVAHMSHHHLPTMIHPLQPLPQPEIAHQLPLSVLPLNDMDNILQQPQQIPQAHQSSIPHLSSSSGAAAIPMIQMLPTTTSIHHNHSNSSPQHLHPQRNMSGGNGRGYSGSNNTATNISTTDDDDHNPDIILALIARDKALEGRFLISFLLLLVC